MNTDLNTRSINSHFPIKLFNQPEPGSDDLQKHVSLSSVVCLLDYYRACHRQSRTGRQTVA